MSKVSDRIYYILSDGTYKQQQLSSLIDKQSSSLVPTKVIEAKPIIVPIIVTIKVQALSNPYDIVQQSTVFIHA